MIDLAPCYKELSKSSGVSMDKTYLLEGLLRWNYFPNQKSTPELPPVFSTRQLTPDVAEKISKIGLRLEGYDQVEYLSTRYNNVCRVLSIPHPLPYVHLVQAICEHWDKLKYISENEHSLIKPSVHPDGRIVVMDYEVSSKKMERALKFGFGKKFKVHTDITNCFPSIYTHALSWATVGFKYAKNHKSLKYSAEWFNQLDEKSRMLKRNETQGVAIGPASSNVLSEIILAQVDKEMSSKNYSYIRYIDDYTCYCDTFEEAQFFLRDLNDLLRTYKLTLNIKKTEIIELPAPVEADWIVELSTRMPVGTSHQPPKSGKYYAEVETLRFLDFAVRLNSKASDGSVLKFAVKSIIYQLHEDAVQVILDYILNLARHYPLLIPTIDQLLLSTSKDPANYKTQLNSILHENALNRRSDGMAWAIYYLNRFNLEIGDESIKEVMLSKDCVAITCLYLSGKLDHVVIPFVEKLDTTDLFELDQYWLIRYQLYFDDKIKEVYQDKEIFDILKVAGVSFVPDPNVQTAGEVALVVSDFKTVP